MTAAAAEALVEELRASLIPDWMATLEPPPELTVSQWAEEHRRLPETSAARGGRWRNETAPYLVGIMDAARDPRVRKIVMVKSVQSGGSEALNNIIGYHVQHDPCPMLVVQPTHGAAEAYSKERLADMIRSTPALAEVVRDRAQPRTHAHQAESTLALKIFPGGFIALGGSNTPNTFARWSVRLTIADDFDRFEEDVGKEGDPADLLVNRTTSFYDALSIFVSTPTLKGGRIDTLFQRSDQRRYFVACPHCGRQDWITWNDKKHIRVRYDGDDPTTARLECPAEDFGGCGGVMLEADRRAMVSGGDWRPTADPLEPGLAGFHLPGMVSTIGVTLESLVGKWLSAQARGKPTALQVFVNTVLAEGWEDREATIEPHALLARREHYGDDVEVPSDAVCLTAGIDVQIDRLELQVQAWGLADERWVVDARAIPGDPKRAETWAALLDALSVRYAHESGHRLPIHATCIDSGFETDEVYAFVQANQHRTLFATKGVQGRKNEPIITTKPMERTYGRRGRPVRLYTINTDEAKRDVMAAVALRAALKPGERSPGLIHFPEKVDEEFFAQLTAEHREPKRNKAGVSIGMVWVQTRARNEALDTAVLCLAAFRKLNPNIRHMAELLASTPVPPKSGGSEMPPAPPRRKERREPRRSSYLG